MVINPKVQKFYVKLIADLNEYLSPAERVEKFQLLFEEWNSDNGELTPTLKVRRRIVFEKFEKEILALY
jgi:long-chain acyl-CoA synthetase